MSGRSTAEIAAALRYDDGISTPTFGDLEEAADRLVELDAQIARLATFIMDEVPGEPSQSEGAVDCAIRLLARPLAHWTPPRGTRIPGVPPWQAGRRLQ